MVSELAALCLVLPSACLPSAFDAADKAERARELGVVGTDAGVSTSAAGKASSAGTNGGSGRGGHGNPSDAGASGQSVQGVQGVNDDLDASVPLPAAGAGANAGAAGANTGGMRGSAGASGVHAGAGGMGGAHAGSAGASCGDTTSDPLHCGSCQNDCTATSALVSCQNSQCVRACTTGRADCNEDLSFGSQGDGCEISIVDDVKNCGGCNIQCDRGWGIVPECDARACNAFTAAVGTPTASGTALHGSPDGGQTFEQLCGRNEVMVGLDAAADNEVLYGLAVACAPLLLSGVPGNLAMTTGDAHAFNLLGNTITSPLTPMRTQCPPGSIVTAIDGADWYYNADKTLLTIKSLNLSCSQVNISAGSSVTFTSNGMLNLGSPASALETFSDVCPAGSAAVGFNGRYGALIDAIQTQCAPLSLSKAASGSSIQTADTSTE